MLSPRACCALEGHNDTEALASQAVFQAILRFLYGCFKKNLETPLRIGTILIMVFR